MKPKQTRLSMLLPLITIGLLTVLLSGCTTSTTKNNTNSSTAAANTSATPINACKILTVEQATSAFGSSMTRYSPAEGVVNNHDGTYQSYGCTYTTPDSTGLIEISIYRYNPSSSTTARARYDQWNTSNAGVPVSGFGDAAYWGAANVVMGTLRGNDYIEVKVIDGQKDTQDKAKAAMTTILKNLI